MPAYDPLIYRGCAAHYLAGRPPYSPQLREVIARELALDGSGWLVDIGCGPGILAVELAPLFEQGVGVDPDAEMLEEARRHAARRGATNLTWRQARGEELAGLGLPPLRVVSFGQSFHWTDREPMAELVWEALAPGGAIVLVAPDPDSRPAPPGPGEPRIPDPEVQALITRFLGAERRAGSGFRRLPPDRYEDALRRTRFGSPRTVHAPGDERVLRDVDGVISNYLSMSYAAPHLFGDRLTEFVSAMRALLAAHTPTGRFWDWPGDTAILIARKS